LASLLMDDKRANPSHYSMLTISEGATLAGGDMVLAGEADAYGHRKLGGIGAVVGELITRITGEEIVLQNVAYLMRSGSPDSLDLMVATNYAVMAADLILEGASGRMVALRSGTYTNVPISVTREGVKRVDVDELYDVDQYRPKVRHVAGKPMFLY
jgi:6-phosphofructokinase 1